MSLVCEEEPRITRACTIARQIEDFDLLIEDMDLVFGEEWGNLDVSDALTFLNTSEAQTVELLAVALDDEDSVNLTTIRAIIENASAQKIKVLLIAEALSPIALHQLLRAGADDFVPYPLPERALQDALNKLNKPQATAPVMASQTEKEGRNGAVFAVHALAGGAGASTFSANLAWELTLLTETSNKKVCILDFDFQSGSISTYLDLARTEKVYELLCQTSEMDAPAFLEVLQTFNEKLHVLTAPSDMLPFDLLTPEEIERLIEMARNLFDFVIIDMPRPVLHWSEAVLNASDLYFALLELDLRSAQNALRLIRALKADGIGMEQYRYVLNRAPRFTDLAGKTRAKRMAESLGVSFGLSLPDGGSQVRDSNDHGLPLAEFAPKNPLRKEIRKFTEALYETSQVANLAAE